VTGSGQHGPGTTGPRERADSDVSILSAAKGRQVAAGAMRTSTRLGTRRRDKLHGRGSPESGLPARSNSHPHLKRHLQLDFPKSPSGFGTLSNQSSDKAFQSHAKAL